MTVQEFGKQVDRLKSQWPSSYGEERLKLIWEMYAKVDASTFERIVTLALNSQRSAPLAEDLARLENEVKNRRVQERFYDGFSSQASPMQVLARAAQNNKTADKDYVKACMRLAMEKFAGKITLEQFEKMCDELDHVAFQLTGRRSANGPIRGPGKDVKQYRED